MLHWQIGLSLLWLAQIESPSAKDDWSKMAAIVPKSMACYRAKSPPAIDGKLDDPAWQAIPFSDDFVDIEGSRKPKPRFRTRMKMLWDDDCLYIAAEMEEPNVWATVKKRDAIIFVDNDFEIFLDPDGDNHQYMEFEINAFNTGWDLRLPRPYRDLGKADIGWDLEGIRTAVSIRGTLNHPNDVDDGWSVELAIPWKALAQYAGRPTPPRVRDFWRFNASRVEWRVCVANGKTEKIKGLAEDNWVWSPQGVVDMHRPERWGWIHFVAEDRPPARFEPDPSAGVRELLCEVYYAQWTYKKKHGQWATNMDQLRGTRQEGHRPDDKIRIEKTETGYRASTPLRLPDGKVQTWHIDHDSRISCD